MLSGAARGDSRATGDAFVAGRALELSLLLQQRAQLLAAALHLSGVPEP